MERLATGEKYLQASSVIQRALIQHYDLYQKEFKNGFECYTLFHRKGVAPDRPFPESLYIRERDIIQPAAETSTTDYRPTGRAAARLITSDYESDVINNNALDTREKIETTVHCSCQVMKDLFGRTAVAENDFEVIRQIGYSFLCFTDVVLRESAAVEMLISRLMNGSHNEYTHAVHVSLYAGMLAGELNQLDILRLDAQRLKNLYIGALLHDLGKTRIRPDILRKTGKLTRDEFDIVKRHPIYSAELAQGSGLHRETIEIMLYHHEKWNGGGYPHNISFQAIPPLVRVVSICDVFDALTTRRSYRPARKPFEALTLMKRRLSGSFYVQYLDTFIQFLGSGSGY